MLKRIITAIVAICVMVPILLLDHTWILPAAISICAVIGIWEMLTCIGLRKNLFLTIPLCLIAAFFPLYTRFLRQSTASPGTSLQSLLKLSVAIAFIMALYIFGVAVYDNKRVSITDAGLLYASCFYIIAAFTALIYIHDYINGGEHIYLLTFISAWATDIFAYFTGRLFGKHKLIPAVSPKKTVEGAIGGMVFCVIGMVVFGFVIERFFNPDGIIHANYLVLAISGVFISVVSQIGDLIMSLVKRQYGIKDYGKLFPGHGGILDRFDSVLAVSLILAFICTYFDLLPITK
jgi:phosphatidate cytidylyltransferase